MKILFRLSILATVLLIMGVESQAQRTYEQKEVVQFSGKVVTSDIDGDIRPMPYVNISVLGTRRGTSSDEEGFFSLVTLKGDTVIFSQIGYKDVTVGIPDTLAESHYSWVQIMSQDSFLLPEAVIYPWPDREHFEIEFLAIDISDELRSRKDENLANQVIEEMRYSLPTDGTEATTIELRRMGEEAVYAGQLKPMNILSPIAWANFVEAWRRGDFKKKKDKKK